jgi:hypothetical protein
VFRRAQVLYLLSLLVVALVAGTTSYFGTWAVRVAACRSGPRPGTYLAYCSHPLYGSYEHAAYALGFEPSAVQALQRADALLLGNSRLQFAFSTLETEQFFRERSATYHLLGFGYAEGGQFPRELLDRYRPSPKVVIINADPFFSLGLSPPAQLAVSREPAAWADAVRKKAFAFLLPWLCRVPELCPQAFPALYRETLTGQWVWHELLLPRVAVGPEITNVKVTPWTAASLPHWQAVGETFLARLSLPRSCVILTAVPNPQIDGEAIAAVLGQRLGLPVVLPRVAPLHSPDENHLSAESAARWSAAFLAEAGPRIEACLNHERAKP